MRLHHLLFAISLLSVFAFADEQKTQDQRVGEGIMHVLKGEKQQAWDILFPEAKAGNVIAMYHLGVMMMKSSEYPNNLERAKQFFSAAAKLGHKGSAAMLVQVENMIGKSGAAPSIAGTSGVPLPRDMEAARAAFAKVQSTIGRYVGSLQTAPPKITVKTFITETDSNVKDIATLSDELKANYGDKVDFQFYVLIDPASWNPKKAFTSAAENLPLIGYRPDLNRQEASKYGVRSTPAIVLVPEKGQARILTNNENLKSELASALR